MKSRYLIITATLALFSSIAVAGFTQPIPVEIDFANKVVIGDMWTARTADNEFEFIGCGFRKFDDGEGNKFEFGFCQATDADENFILCLTENPNLLETLRAASDFSFITFSWTGDDPEAAECTRIGFSTQSFYLPNFKIQKGMGGGEDEDDG